MSSVFIRLIKKVLYRSNRARARIIYVNLFPRDLFRPPRRSHVDSVARIRTLRSLRGLRDTAYTTLGRYALIRTVGLVRGGGTAACTAAFLRGGNLTRPSNRCRRCPTLAPIMSGKLGSRMGGLRGRQRRDVDVQ